MRDNVRNREINELMGAAVASSCKLSPVKVRREGEQFWGHTSFYMWRVTSSQLLRSNSPGSVVCLDFRPSSQRLLCTHITTFQYVDTTLTSFPSISPFLPPFLPSLPPFLPSFFGRSWVGRWSTTGHRAPFSPECKGLHRTSQCQGSCLSFTI